MEVDLELSVGGSFRNLETSKPEIDPPLELHGCSRTEDAKAKRKIQAQRRREAKKKREESKKKGMGSGGGGGGGGNEGMTSEMQQLQSRARDRERRENDDQADLTHHKSNIGSHPNHGTAEGPIQMMVPIQYAYPSRVQYVPFAFPYVVPCWTPATGVQPVKPLPASKCSGAGSVLSEWWTNFSGSAPHHDEGSSDIGSFSSHAGTAPPPQSSDTQGQSEQSVSSSQGTSSDKTTSCDEKVSPMVKDPATRREETPRSPLKKVRNGNGPTAVEQMPCVSVTGKGPNGRTVTGFLFRYTKAEISIVCVCHGSSFSPAGFVEHAGGVDVSHPLRHITVIPSAFACS